MTLPANLGRHNLQTPEMDIVNIFSTFFLFLNLTNFMPQVQYFFLPPPFLSDKFTIFFSFFGKQIYYLFKCI